MEEKKDDLEKVLSENEPIISENKMKIFWTQNIQTGTGMLVLMIVLLVAVILGILFQSSLLKKEEKVLVQELVPVQKPIQKIEKKEHNGVEQKVLFSEVNTGQKKIIKKGMIAWQEPQDVGDFGLTAKDLYNGTASTSRGIKYVLVGKLLSGEYEGGEVYIIASGFREGLGTLSPDIYKFIKHEQKLIFWGVDKKNNEFEKVMLENYFNLGNWTREINEDVVVEELEYPEAISVKNERQKLVKNEYDEAFFDNQGLREVAEHNQYGKIWTTDENKLEQESFFELNSYLSNNGGVIKKNYYEAFHDFGFYLQSPDGLAISYRLVPDVFEENQDDQRYLVLKATWDGGIVNDVKYELTPSGCGMSNYAYNETNKIDKEKNLIRVGTTDKGDVLYGYKDSNQPGFEKLYEEIYWAGEGEEKKSPEDFLKMQPKVFWEDPFGRLLAFYRADIFSPAECGKPVIYLYPEEKTDVEVKVLPGKGISISDPAYINGWKVSADSKGNLYNYADGKNYPYLFWEGQGDVPYKTPEEGFMVKKENLDNFFDEKLAQLGMIGQEIKDFKEYWLLEMEKENKPYYFVTFLGKGFIDKLAPLEISPKPDTVIRVLMDYYGMDEYKEVPGFSMRTPERKGFVVVEWGGMLKGSNVK